MTPGDALLLAEVRDCVADARPDARPDADNGHEKWPERVVNSVSDLLLLLTRSSLGADRAHCPLLVSSSHNDPTQLPVCGVTSVGDDECCPTLSVTGEVGAADRALARDSCATASAADPNEGHAMVCESERACVDDGAESIRVLFCSTLGPSIPLRISTTRPETSKNKDTPNQFEFKEVSDDISRTNKHSSSS
jgi:hypothetical protein